MKLTGFQILHYRNIIDSGWIDTGNISSIVGQNECGKSNLLRAAKKFPFFHEFLIRWHEAPSAHPGDLASIA